MTRTPSALFLVVALSGCQHAYVAETPTDLNGRLARIEETRLSHADARQAPRGRASPFGAPSRVSANRPPSLPAQLAVAAQHNWHDELATMTLTDLGDLQESGGAGNQEPSGVKPQASSAETEREDKYLRRPPLPSFWETAARDLKEMPGDLWHDTKRVYANPVNLAILGASYAGSLAIQETGPDDTVEHRFNRNHDGRAPEHIMNSDDWRDAFGAIGNPGTHFALAGVWYLLGQQTMDGKTYEVGKTLFSALMINGVTVLVGQTASWDKSPNGEWGTFPSGHTSSSFVFASVMHEAYGHLVGVPLYGLATLAGIERLDDREHYFSDVVMGAVLGTVVGHSVASGRDPEFFGWKLLPYASPQNGSGVAFAKTFE